MTALLQADTIPGEQHAQRSGLLQRLLRTEPEWAPAMERVVLGGVMLAHGSQKVFGWFGGGGLRGTIDFFESALHLPAAVAVFVMLSDFVGALALIAGLFTRVAAVGTGLVMLGAVATVHAPNGFFMNWFGNQAGEGFEFHLLALALVSSLLLRGGGRASLDQLLARSGERGAATDGT